MKLFLHDEKHDQIISEEDFGELTKDEVRLLEKAFSFLEKHHILNRYKKCVLADTYTIESQVDEFEESCDPCVVFHTNEEFNPWQELYSKNINTFDDDHSMDH